MNSKWERMYKKRHFEWSDLSPSGSWMFNEWDSMVNVVIYVVTLSWQLQYVTLRMLPKKSIWLPCMWNQTSLHKHNQTGESMPGLCYTDSLLLPSTLVWRYNLWQNITLQCQFTSPDFLCLLWMIWTSIHLTRLKSSLSFPVCTHWELTILEFWALTQKWPNSHKVNLREIQK